MNRIAIVAVAAALLAGCAMFGSWQAIPPPGGCDQCHSQKISANWQVTLQPVTLNDETGKVPWQKSESLRPVDPSPLEQKKITELRCFRCHKGPNRAHTEYKGRYHH